MRKQSIFSCLLIFLVISTAPGYTVILKTGKTVEGMYLRETDSHIVVRDQAGITLSFRKTTLDLEAMSRINTPKAGKKEETRPAPQTPATGSSETPKSRRVYTNEDLKDLPELSVVESDQPSEIPLEESQRQQPQEPQPFGIEAETYWKNRTMEIAGPLYAAEDNYNRLQQECADARKAFDWYVLSGYWTAGWPAPIDPAYICDQANQAKNEYDLWLKRLDDFQDLARKEGALPGWVDPERW